MIRIDPYKGDELRGGSAVQHMRAPATRLGHAAAVGTGTASSRQHSAGPRLQLQAAAEQEHSGPEHTMVDGASSSSTCRQTDRHDAQANDMLAAPVRPLRDAPGGTYTPQRQRQRSRQHTWGGVDRCGMAGDAIKPVTCLIRQRKGSRALWSQQTNASERNKQRQRHPPLR